MKFDLSLGVDGCKTVISFESGAYDALAASETFFIENRIRFITADRLAIACALLSYDLLASEITFPKPCSPEIGRELENFFAPRNVRVLNTDFNPRAKPISERTAVLALPPPYDGQELKPKCDEVTFGITSDQSYTSYLGVSEVLVSCNLRAVSQDNMVSFGLGLLGVCILFAEDLSISRIVIPEKLFQAIPNLDNLMSMTLYSNIELISEQSMSRFAENESEL